MRGYALGDVSVLVLMTAEPSPYMVKHKGRGPAMDCHEISNKSPWMPGVHDDVIGGVTWEAAIQV